MLVLSRGVISSDALCCDDDCLCFVVRTRVLNQHRGLLPATKGVAKRDALILPIHMLAECVASVTVLQFLTAAECKIMGMERG